MQAALFGTALARMAKVASCAAFRIVEAALYGSFAWEGLVSHVVSGLAGQQGCGLSSS